MSPELTTLLRAFEATSAQLSRIERKIDAGADSLQPLYKIILCTPNAARMKCKRDPQLAKLGVRVGKNLLFKPVDVLAYYKALGKKVEGSDE